MSAASVQKFLYQATPLRWLEQAVVNLPTLLIDHAHCEKKAASGALQLMYRYPQRLDLLKSMSQLAREELLHFEQVLSLMQEFKVQFKPIRASSYAKRLHQDANTTEPMRLVDSLLIGAIIEARSCERFEALAGHFERQRLHPKLVRYYRYLLKSESRHYLDYIALAEQTAQLHALEPEVIAHRLQQLLSLDQSAILTDDREFRFHSGASVSGIVSQRRETVQGIVVEEAQL